MARGNQRDQAREKAAKAGKVGLLRYIRSSDRSNFSNDVDVEM